MLHTVCNELKALWRPLVATDLLFKAISFALLTPLVACLFRGFLSISGRTVLADADIARFFFHPIGWIALIVVGGGVISVFALEQAILMTVSLSFKHGVPLTVLGRFHFLTRKAIGVFQIASRIVVRVLIISVPFVAVGGGIFAILATDHDINYYLTDWPREFRLAVLIIVALLLILAVLLVRFAVNCLIAIQLHLFEGISPSDCLKKSRERMRGHRKAATKWIIVWGVSNFLISTAASAAVVSFGRQVVPAASGHLWTLALTLGVVLAMWGVVNVGINILAVVSFALLQAEVYHQCGGDTRCVLPEEGTALPAWLPKWTNGRVVSVAIIAVAGATLFCLTAIRSIRLDDDVEVTAHRGASGRAPENTMAAVRQAIRDRADWVEIDVQESKDGVVVVAHDSDLMKVSGEKMKIWEGTAEELQKIDIGSFFGKEFQDERVPTLSAVLAECRGRVGVNIELKYYGHDQNLEQKVVDLIEQYKMESDVVVMSLKPDGIRKIKELRPEWTVGLLTAVVAGDLTKAEADFFAVNTKIATRPFIRKAHAKSKKVFVWTVNDVITMSSMISRGADNLITDNPALARRVLSDRAQMSPVERVLVELAFFFEAAKGEHEEP